MKKRNKSNGSAALPSNKLLDGNETNVIPEEAINRFARCLLPEIQKYFESERGRQEFEEWKSKQKQGS